MSERQFHFRSDEEDPLYLDRDRRDDRPSAVGPLYIERPPAPKRVREKRPFPVLTASIVTFLLAAGAAAIFLEPPAFLRQAVAGIVGDAPAPEPRAEAPTSALDAAEPSPEIARATEAAAEEAARAAEALAPEPEPEPVAAPREQPKAEPPPPAPKPKAAPVKKAAAPKAQQQPKGLDLDALERSLE
jgi:hypothetical protein